MNVRATLGFVGCLAGPLLLTSAPAEAQVQRLAIGVQSASVDATRNAWAPLVEDMGRKLGVAATLVVDSQSNIVSALREGKVDVVWLSSSAAIDAVTAVNAEAFALYYNVNGTNGYKGIVITRADSAIKTLDEALAAGKYTYASGAKTSTSGYVLPQYFLFGKRNTTPESVFKSVVYGSHFENLATLWAGKVDVAVNNTTDFTVYQESREPASKGKFRVLWESPLVPNDVLMYRSDMAAQNKTQLKAFFLQTYGTTDQEKELYRKASGIRNFVAADNSLLDPVSEFKFATERSGIAANAKLSEAEKAAETKALEERIQKFKASLAR